MERDLQRNGSFEQGKPPPLHRQSHGKGYLSSFNPWPRPQKKLQHAHISFHSEKLAQFTFIFALLSALCLALPLLQLLLQDKPI
jgi:hypothetical protein